MRKAISLYCDESCHLKNNGNHVSMIGYVGVPHNSIRKHKKAIVKLRQEHNLYTEIKWTKVSRSKIDFYKALLDYFLKSDIIFRGLIIPTGHFGHPHITDSEYYKVFYKLLSHETNLNFEYNIYIDIKDSHSHKRVSELKKELNRLDTFNLKNVQTIRSYESSFIQLSDLIIGAFSYDLNIENSVATKEILVEKLKGKFNDDSYDYYKKIDGNNIELFLISLNKI